MNLWHSKLPIPAGARKVNIIKHHFVIDHLVGTQRKGTVRKTFRDTRPKDVIGWTNNVGVFLRI